MTSTEHLQYTFYLNIKIPPVVSHLTYTNNNGITSHFLSIYLDMIGLMFLYTCTKEYLIIKIPLHTEKNTNHGIEAYLV